MNFNKSDILAVLELFNLSDEDSDHKTINDIEKTKHSEGVYITSLTFNSKKILLIADNLANNDVDYINKLAKQVNNGASYKLISPTDKGIGSEYSAFFKGKHIYVLTEHDTKSERLDVFLSKINSSKTRSTYKKMIESGLVTVDGVVARKPSLLVSKDNDIKVSELDVDYVTFNPKVIYEDDDILVLDKPAGMLSHAKDGFENEQTVADIVKDTTTYLKDSTRPGIVHRLDRATSGVIVTVKNSFAAEFIKSQFKSRTIEKKYVAIAKGNPSNPSALINLPIGRNPSNPGSFRVDANGKPAKTKYEVSDSNDKYSIINVYPLSGRTHQIRVHLNYIGCPIVGDTLYGNIVADRMFLHANEITLTIPRGEKKTFVADLPTSFDLKRFE